MNLVSIRRYRCSPKICIHWQSSNFILQTLNVKLKFISTYTLDYPSYTILNYLPWWLFFNTQYCIQKFTDNNPCLFPLLRRFTHVYVFSREKSKIANNIIKRSAPEIKNILILFFAELSVDIYYNPSKKALQITYRVSYQYKLHWIR